MIATPFGAIGGTVSIPHGDIESDSLAAEMVSSVLPQYPPLARQARVQGVVALTARVGADGKVEEVTVITGHPLLVAAAKDAVMSWTYRPRAVPATARILINFHF
jgi:TonB family protein